MAVILALCLNDYMSQTGFSLAPYQVELDPISLQYVYQVHAAPPRDDP
jgi:hypothetical protein